MDTFTLRGLLWRDGVFEDTVEGYDGYRAVQSTIFLNIIVFTVLHIFASVHSDSVDKRTLQEQTALLLAVSCEHLSCARCLLEAGADPDISNKYKETPLFKGTTVILILKHFLGL